MMPLQDAQVEMSGEFFHSRTVVTERAPFARRDKQESKEEIRRWKDVIMMIISRAILVAVGQGQDSLKGTYCYYYYYY